MDEARRQALRAAHLACVQGRRKALDDAAALIVEIGAGPVARAD